MNHLEKSKELHLSAEEYVLVGGSVLDIYKLRASSDIDVVVSRNAFQELKERGWKVDPQFKEKWGRERLVHDVFEIYTDLIWEKFGYYLPFDILKDIAKQIDGVYIQPLGLLLLAKLDMRRDKDLTDITLIEKHLLKTENSKL